MKFGTKAIHAGIEPDPSTGAIMTPIYQTSTYVQNSLDGHQEYAYARSQNPTRTALQQNLAALENGKHGICFSSGVAAIDAVIRLFSPGDEIITTNDLYGGTYRLFTKVYEKYGIHFKFVSMSEASSIAEHISENTKMIWVETPTNPMMNIIDIAAVAKLSTGNKIILAVDNTFASPYLQNPLDLGADIVMHSVTKYLGGHSDVVMGALVVNDEELAKKLLFIQNTCGAVPAPQDCFLVIRGIKTLHLRMERHSQNGKTIAGYLKNHPKVDKVYWPGFEDHPNHEIATKQMRDFGGMISFSLLGNKESDARKVMENFHIFALAESLGGVESLCGHPATMTHASIPKEEREKVGLVDSLIRLSVGVEDAEDLKNDLANALSKI
ncbi:cystathionine beta-lyase [Algoriphagus chordae]|uniref:Cystathionine beta-lyase n=2 Tax=Algoriphagus chordae TaxID=237019 RepID=A0A2W7R505_9BACT|nr:cystathionine beta-lyase [Algoriphagus chordae]